MHHLIFNGGGCDFDASSTILKKNVSDEEIFSNILRNGVLHNFIFHRM